jgi:hypothetical protein
MTVMRGVSATRFAANVRRTSPKARGKVLVAARAETSERARPVNSIDQKVVRGAANDAVAERRTAQIWPPLTGTGRHAKTGTTAAGTRAHERRWRDASIIFVERRRGDFYKYASIVLCAALWVQVWVLYRI